MRWTLALFLLCPLAAAVEDENLYERIQQAEALEHRGLREEAFLRFLALPAQEKAALRVSREAPEQFLKLLAKADPAAPQTKLLEGELHRLAGRKDAALEAYRVAWARYGVNYPVEVEENHAYLYVDRSHTAFMSGPGSHRDNWLIRRFIAMEAWDDAAAAFRDLWAEHQRRSQPPNTFDGRGMLFALDYAFFLKQRQKPDAAREILLEPLLRIDLDRDPNRAALRHGLRPSHGGVSRKEYIRLVHGEFRKDGLEDSLEAKVKEAAEKDPRMLRTLARIRFLQGRTDDAVALELAFLAQVKGRGGAPLDPFSALTRKAAVLDEAQKTPEAIAAYEELLKLPFRIPEQPHGDEVFEEHSRAITQADFEDAAPQLPTPANPHAQADFQKNVLARLQSLYGSIGQPEKALDTTLREFTANPALLECFALTEQTAQQAKAIGKTDTFTEWAKKNGAIENAKARLHLRWLLGDQAAAAQALIDVNPNLAANYEARQWKEKFREAGPDAYRILLRKWVAVAPTDAQAQLELLDLEERFEGDGVILALEAVLTSGIEAFPRGKGARNRTQFSDYYDLAYRLMRLYEKKGAIGKLQALGLRAARGERPFDVRGRDPDEYRTTNGLRENAEACLALAIQHADAPGLAELQRALKGSPWVGAAKQVERQLNAPNAANAPAADWGWANVPEGVRLVASNENVLCLARDSRHVYAGHPWGIAVYDLSGERKTRIALGEAVLALVASETRGEIWAGTPMGLIRVQRDGWGIARQQLDLDIPEKNRHRDRPEHDNGVEALTLDGDELWIGMQRTVQRLDTRTLQLRAFTQEEMKSKRGGVERFVLDGDLVWAQADQELLRYDKLADNWERVAFNERPVSLSGIVDGTLWGDVYFDDTIRHRACRIDRKTLEVEPIPLSDRGQEACIHRSWNVLGTFEGKTAFLADQRHFVFNTETKHMEPIDDPTRQAPTRVESPIPAELHVGNIVEIAPGSFRCSNDISHEHRVGEFRFKASAWNLLVLPGGRRILGGKVSTAHRFEYPREERGDQYFRETFERDGGLYLISKDAAPRRISSADCADQLRGDRVHDAVPATKGGAWLCTNVGLARIDEQGRVGQSISRDEGLVANLVAGGVELGGKTYFSTAWDDAAGGLAVFDPATSVFTSFTTADGLDSNKILALAANGTTLTLTFASSYRRHEGGNYERFPPGRFDTATGTFVSGGPAVEIKQDQSDSLLATEEAMPWLGGYVFQKKIVGGRTLLCGTRGAIVAGAAIPPLAIAPLGATRATGNLAAMLEDARRRKVKVGSVAELEAALNDPNILYRANALLAAPASPECIPLLGESLGHPNLRLRASALALLLKIDDPRAIPLLQARINDPELGVRTAVTSGLLRLNTVPDLKRIEELLKNGYEQIPVGAWESRSLTLVAGRVHASMVSNLTPELLVILAKHPPSMYPGDKSWPPIVEGTAAYLKRNPAAIEALVKGPVLPLRDGRSDIEKFLMESTRAAAKELLPVLHAALVNPERTVRANAALLCGMAADPASIQPLLKALELPSGLSRAYAAHALAALKATEALPRLRAMYVDARNDQENGRGSGYMAQQMAAVQSSQFNSIRAMEAIGKGWDDLKRADAPKVINPRRDETLLTPGEILKDIAAIGPEHSQDFYRTLAGESHSEGREEAARRLSECKAEEREKNIAVLKNLLGTGELDVQWQAAISLLKLGDPAGAPTVAAGLLDENMYRAESMRNSLHTIRERPQLAAVRKIVEARANEKGVRKVLVDEALKVLRELEAKPEPTF